MDNTVINISSVVSSVDYRPFVQLRWGKEGCQMTPDEARQHAYSILAVANAAETDSIMANFLLEKVGLEGVNMGAVLKDFRELRERRHAAKDGMHRTKV